MAEAKRRTDVKKFAHMTAYPRAKKESQRTLFEEALLNSSGHWVCTRICETVPPVGSTVLVRIGSNRTPDVLWGNQAIATLSEALGNDLATTIGNETRAGGILATVVSRDDTQSQIAIQFAQG